MQKQFLIFIMTCLFTGCNTSEAKKTDKGTPKTGQTTNTNSKSSSSSKPNGYWQKLEMRELKDGSGMVAALIPLPTTWKINVNGAAFSGPNGIKVTELPLKSFMVNYNQSTQFAYDQTGQKMRPLPPIDQLIKEDFIPWGYSKGLQYVKHYELPEVSKMDKWYSDQLFKAMPTNSFVKTYGSDWKDKNGKPYFLIIRVNASESQYMQTWYYMPALLEADASVFEMAKKQYIFALSNMRYNLEPIMKYNKEEAQRVGQSWAAFNKRMADNQAAFEAHQRAHVNKTEAINESIMSNWKAQNKASDKNQENFIDMMREETNVQHTETGKTYKVQQGANQYWMNNDGEYIGTKLSGYNPNLDENMNEKKWQELKIIKK